MLFSAGNSTRHPLAYAIALASTFMLSIIINYLCSFKGIFINVWDLGSHYSWASSFAEGVQTGILYPRWSSISNHSLGEPSFYYYAPMTYYICALINIALPDVWLSLRMTSLASNWAAGLIVFSFVLDKSVVKALFGAFTVQISPIFFLVLSYNAAFAWSFAMPFYVIVLLLYARQPVSMMLNPLLAVAYAAVCFTHILSGFMIGISLAVADTKSWNA